MEQDIPVGGSRVERPGDLTVENVQGGLLRVSHLVSTRCLLVRDWLWEEMVTEKHRYSNLSP